MRLYVGYSRRKSHAAAQTIANLAPKCLALEYISLNESIYFLETQRVTTGDIYKSSRKLLAVMEAHNTLICFMTPSGNEDSGRKKAVHFCIIA